MVRPEKTVSSTTASDHIVDAVELDAQGRRHRAHQTIVTLPVLFAGETEAPHARKPACLEMKSLGCAFSRSGDTQGEVERRMRAVADHEVDLLGHGEDDHAAVFAGEESEEGIEKIGGSGAGAEAPGTSALRSS
jgi:hypothetical protein